MDHPTDTCVIFNPAAGRGQAAKRLRQLQRTLGSHGDFRPTHHAGHAIELAREATLEGFANVTAAGGDGTVHEVANGILQARRPEVAFGILPIGSANDYVASLQYERSGSLANGNEVVDVGVVRAPDGREKYFVCCLGLGLNGAVTMESRKIRRLQGLMLYGLATIKAILYHYGTPAMKVSIDDGPEQITSTLMMSVLVGRREGSFVMAPTARMDDGYLDFVHSGNLSRWEVFKFLPRLALFGPPENHPKVKLGRCKKVKLESEKPLVVHVDGEFFCVPKDDVRVLEIEILPRALRVVL